MANVKIKKYSTAQSDIFLIFVISHKLHLTVTAEDHVIIAICQIGL